MTRRIATAILLTSWAILLLGGLASYLSVRRVLLAELDDSLVLRASSLPEVLGIRTSDPAVPANLPPGDRYIIRNHLGQTLARPTAQPLPTEVPDRHPRVLDRYFATLADSTRTRTITLAFPSPGGGGGADDASAEPLTVIYSGSAVRYDQLLSTMTWTLLAIVLAAGAIVAAVAVAVAKVALRPLRAASATLATIDDRTLDRRLDVPSLPAEMRPVGHRMNQLLARLEQGIRERKRFLVDAAHELRTPVAALTTSIEVSLRRPRDAAQLARTLNDCLSDARLLRRLVEALLDQFRLDTNPAAAVPVDTDVSETLDLCCQSLASVARLKDVTLNRLYPDAVHFPTQPDRLRSVVGNLLSNAIEYNRPGGRVDLTCDRTDTGLLITVRDDGPGIPEEDLPHVFEAFYRTRTSTQAPAEGHAGLGLYLVQSHVQTLGGTCELNSKPNQGCEFRIHLPHRINPPPKAIVENIEPQESHLALT